MLLAVFAFNDHLAVRVDLDLNDDLASSLGGLLFGFFGSDLGSLSFFLFFLGLLLLLGIHFTSAGASFLRFALSFDHLEFINVLIVDFEEFLGVLNGFVNFG